ncbi:MAG: response regulator transcription factor [Pontibacterium sp.]
MVKSVFVLTTSESVAALVTPMVKALSVKIDVGNTLPQLSSGKQEAALLLVDCGSYEWDEVVQHLEQAQTNLPKATAAILGVPASADVTDALRWPILAGIFDDNFEDSLIQKGISELVNHRYWFSRAQMNTLAQLRRVPAKPIANPTESLSRRELEVLALTSQGKSNADIAEELFLSQHTVKTHLYNLYRKLGVVNRTQAVHWYQTTMVQ